MIEDVVIFKNNRETQLSRQNNQKKKTNFSSEEHCHNKLFQSALTGKVHKFDETMGRENINKKIDGLFGW